MSRPCEVEIQAVERERREEHEKHFQIQAAERKRREMRMGRTPIGRVYLEKEKKLAWQSYLTNVDNDAFVKEETLFKAASQQVAEAKKKLEEFQREVDAAEKVFDEARPDNILEACIGFELSSKNQERAKRQLQEKELALAEATPNYERAKKKFTESSITYREMDDEVARMRRELEKMDKTLFE